MCVCTLCCIVVCICAAVLLQTVLHCHKLFRLIFEHVSNGCVGQCQGQGKGKCWNQSSMRTRQRRGRTKLRLQRPTQRQKAHPKPKLMQMIAQTWQNTNWQDNVKWGGQSAKPERRSMNSRGCIRRRGWVWQIMKERKQKRRKHNMRKQKRRLKKRR